MASLGELFVELGVFADTKELENFENKLEQVKGKMEDTVKQSAKTVEQQTKHNKSLKDGAISTRGMIATMTAFVTALVGAGVALNRLTDSLVQSNQKMLDLTRTSDIALSTFQQWDDVGKMFGVDNAAQQLDNLNQKLFELRLTGQGARGFQLAGINPIGQDAEGVLEQLRGRIRGMDDTSASYLLQQMGIDPKMLHLLRMSREEFEELQNTLSQYRLTDEQTHSIQAMNAQLQIARIQLNYLKNRAILALMPHLIQFTKKIVVFADMLATAVEWIASSNNMFAKMIRWTIKATVVIGALVAGILGIATALKVVRTALMLLTAHPIVAALTALLGAIMLIADDIMHYMNGGGSLIGVIAKGLEDLDIKGFLDFPVPKWLEMLIEAIDFFRGGGKFAREAFVEENVQKIDPNAVKIKTKNGVTYADVPPEFLNMVKEVNTNNSTVNKTSFITPTTNSMINNNNATYDNSKRTNTVNQNIAINTNQPVDSIKQQLQYANRIMA